MTGLILGNGEPQVDEPDEPAPDDEPLGGGEQRLLERFRTEYPQFEPRIMEVRSLSVDPVYQRPVEDKWVNDRVDTFNPALIRSLDVSARRDGVNAVMDGQQRLELLRRKGYTTVATHAFPNLTVQDEAGLFWLLNNELKRMKSYFGFNARRVAGDLEAQAIVDTVERTDFKLGGVSDNQDIIGAITAVEFAYRLDSEQRDECLSPALQTIRASAFYGRKKSLDATMIRSFAQFWRAFPDEAVQDPLLLEVLEEMGSPANLIGLAHDRQEGSDWKLPQLAAAIVAERYNTKLRGMSGVPRTAPSFPGRLDVDQIR